MTELPIILLLAATAFVAGAIDAIAGGGGLLTIPALLTAGIPPRFALGTNKGQAVFGSGAALFRYARAGQIDGQRARRTFPAGLAGALAGASLVLVLDPAVLKPLVLGMLIAAGLVVAFRRPKERAGANDVSVGAKNRFGLAILIASAIGAYDGFFGPGTGTFLIIAFVEWLGLSMARATAEAKVVNFASNLASLALFAWRGVVLWQVALPMAAGQFLGGIAGAHLAVKGGEPVIKRTLLLVIVALVAKLGWDLIA